MYQITVLALTLLIIVINIRISIIIVIIIIETAGIVAFMCSLLYASTYCACMQMHVVACVFESYSPYRSS